jgi:hypothetical protein
MGNEQNAFGYANPRPVNPKKKPPLFQNQALHINIYEPRSPGIQCWTQPRHRCEPTLKFGGRGREYALRVRTYDIFISCICGFFRPCHNGGGFFFGFTGTLFQVLHYEEARAAPQIYVRICKCAPIRTPRRIVCNMNKHTCINTRRTRCTLFQVLHYDEQTHMHEHSPNTLHPVSSDALRRSTCAPIRTPRRIVCNMNKHTCMRTRRTRCEQLKNKSSEVLTKQMWYSKYKTYEIHEIL